ncbi:MAG TPA: BlaI/MecI/CopY family transcriptional regulator [Planctomycetaceae bacterium]|nr:BlaI/MecI/CopY family transcriptional regulator [Planctomycetaceae bacterium]
MEILKVLWDGGPSTVRDVLKVLAARRKRAYTSVMSVTNTMAEKGQVVRKQHGRAFIYSAKRARETLGEMVSHRELPFGKRRLCRPCRGFGDFSAVARYPGLNTLG